MTAQKLSGEPESVATPCINCKQPTRDGHTCYSCGMGPACGPCFEQTHMTGNCLPDSSEEI